MPFPVLKPVPPTAFEEWQRKAAAGPGKQKIGSPYGLPPIFNLPASSAGLVPDWSALKIVAVKAAMGATCQPRKEQDYDPRH